MKATVTGDQTVRTIEIELTGGPIVDVTETWNLKPREIGATHVRLSMHSDQVTGVAVRGQVLKKNGEPGENRATRTWRDQSYDTKNLIRNAPGWIREIVAQAPLGIREFTWTPEELGDPAE